MSQISRFPDRCGVAGGRAAGRRLTPLLAGHHRAVRYQAGLHPAVSQQVIRGLAAVLMARRLEGVCLGVVGLAVPHPAPRLVKLGLVKLRLVTPGPAPLLPVLLRPASRQRRRLENPSAG